MKRACELYERAINSKKILHCQLFKNVGKALISVEELKINAEPKSAPQKINL